jgi:hypothetical protein
MGGLTMTKFYLRLPMQPSVSAALAYAPAVSPARLERGPDGTIRGSVEVPTAPNCLPAPGHVETQSDMLPQSQAGGGRFSVE